MDNDQPPIPSTAEEGRWRIEMSPEAQASLDAMVEEKRQAFYTFLFDIMAKGPDAMREAGAIQGPADPTEITEEMREEIRAAGLDPDAGTFGFIDITLGGPRINPERELFKEQMRPLLGSFTCPRCDMTSYNPTDIKEGYCANCRDWTGE